MILGETREQAYRKHKALYGHRDEDGLIADFLKWTERIGARRIDPDQPLDPALFTHTEDQRWPVGFVRSFAEIAAAVEQLTPRQLVRRVLGGHRLAIGTPREVGRVVGRRGGRLQHLHSGAAGRHRRVQPRRHSAAAGRGRVPDGLRRLDLRLPDPHRPRTAQPG